MPQIGRLHVAELDKGTIPCLAADIRSCLHIRRSYCSQKNNIAASAVGGSVDAFVAGCRGRGFLPVISFRLICELFRTDAGSRSLLSGGAFDDPGKAVAPPPK